MPASLLVVPHNLDTSDVFILYDANETAVRIIIFNIQPREMAHYVADCWDVEIESSYGWIEYVGIADGSAYDLRAHADKSGVALVAQEKFADPKEVEVTVVL
ncbi:hypothetical protein L1987_60555 [Smallanthus sonchifolius]|uniref:Uncharacterized protein n=1 Tax=Smallanthus sonchifolius TaxID=185202 RepID=A0ACB9D8E7_9ASTR|nr:hypothetical protein L1987_60555 [Smallanthus sonchifolius]